MLALSMAGTVVARVIIWQTNRTKAVMRHDHNNSPHYRNCHLCEAICGIEVVQAGNQLDIRGDKEDPFSRGYICPKAVALQDIHFDKDRLRYPVRRTANGWQRIGWDA